MNGSSIHHSTTMMQAESLAHLVAHCMGRESITHLQEVTKDDCDEYWKLMGEITDAEERVQQRENEREERLEVLREKKGWWSK